MIRAQAQYLEIQPKACASSDFHSFVESGEDMLP
jgi:hypothetical protein